MPTEIPGLTQAEAVAKSAALAEVNKQKSWIKANRKALIIGAAVAFVVGLLLGLVL